MDGVTTSRVDLTAEECRRLLAGTRRGHLAFTRDALPAMAPVRYALDGDRVVIPAGSDSEHRLPGRGAVVALGVDDLDAEDDSGWAVTVVGPARSVTDAAGLAACSALGWPRAPSGEGRCYLVLQTTVIRGWRSVAAPPVPDGWPPA